MGTVIDCQGERTFQNLEKCNEIQGNIFSKGLYPIRYPCYINEISFKTNNKFETEEKMIQFDSNNFLETNQNSNYKSNDILNLVEKKNINDKIGLKSNKNDLYEKIIINKSNKKTFYIHKSDEINYIDNNRIGNDIFFINDELKGNEKLEDNKKEIQNEKIENKNGAKEYKNKIKKNKKDEQINNLKDNYYMNKTKENYSNNKKTINNIFLSNFNDKNNMESKIDCNNKKIIDDEKYIKIKKRIVNKSPNWKSNNNLFQKKLGFLNQQENKENIEKNKLDNNNNMEINHSKNKDNFNKNHNNQNKKKENELSHKNKKNANYINNNKRKINKKIKNKNQINYRNNNTNNLDFNISKRFSCLNYSNKDIFNSNNTNNIRRYSGLIKFNKNNNSKLINKNNKEKNHNLLNKKYDKNIFEKSVPEKAKNLLNKTQNYEMQKKGSFEKLIVTPLTASIASNKNKKSLDILKNNPFLENNLYSRKMKNQIPLYRRFSPEDKTKNKNKKRLSELSTNKKIYKSPRSISGPKNYNFRDDLWEYFNKDPFLNSSKNKTAKNIINITHHLSHSQSNNNLNSFYFNNDERNKYDNIDDYYYKINHPFNKSMNYNHNILTNSFYKEKISIGDKEEKLLYNKKIKNCVFNLQKDNKSLKNKSKINNFIKVRIPFNGTQICPILVNYSTNNLFILNYNNINKFNDKSILYDGNIYKLINGQNNSTKLILRYFQITKKCFRYYNNIYSVLIYNERPLVQFDIRHIHNIEIFNLDSLNKLEESKIEFVFSINLINNSDFFIFATDDKEFGMNIINVLNLLKQYYEEDRDLL